MFMRTKLLVVITLITHCCAQAENQLALQQMVNAMSVDEKIGQLCMVAAISDAELNPGYERSVYNLTPAHVEDLIRSYHVGGVVFLGAGTRASTRIMVERFQACANIPLLIALDAEWGSAQRLVDGFCCEKNKQLARRSLEDIRDIGKQIGTELHELGVHINLAPVADVNTNAKNPVIGARSFGDLPELVATKATAYMVGLHDAGVLSCAKHFPGHGDTSVDSHLALPQLQHDKKRLQSIELKPFVHLIAQGVPMIMIGHLAVPAYDATGTPASLSRAIVHDLLRTELGFNGLIVTDGLGMGALTSFGAPGEIACAALCAGNDILLCPVNVPQAVVAIKAALAEGRLSMHELDAHVLRVLAAKQQMQLL